MWSVFCRSIMRFGLWRHSQQWRCHHTLRGTASPARRKSVTHLTIVLNFLTRGWAVSTMPLGSRPHPPEASKLRFAASFLARCQPKRFAADASVPVSEGLGCGFGTPSQNSLGHRTKNFRAIDSTKTRITGAVGMRHQTENVSCAITNAGDVFD